MKDSQEERENLELTTQNIIEWIIFNISDRNKPNPNLKEIEFLVQKSDSANGSIPLRINDIFFSWDRLFRIESIRNKGVKIVIKNCALSNLDILKYLKKQSRYFEYNLMIWVADHNIEKIQSANEKVILFIYF